MKKSLKKSKTIFQLITFLLKVVKITGGSYFILLVDDEAILELAVGSCLDWVQRKAFPSSLQLRGFIVSCHPQCPVSVRNHLVRNSKFMVYFWSHFYAVLFYFVIFFFSPKRYSWQKKSVKFPYFSVVEFLKSFFFFFQFLQGWMSSVKLLEFVIVKEGRERRV